MVYIVLISLITLALLVLLVLGLHRYQLSIAQTNADKYNPLPPLDNISMDRDPPDLTLRDRSDLATGQTNPFDIPTSAEPDVNPDEEGKSKDEGEEQTVIMIPDGSAQQDEAFGDANIEANFEANFENIEEPHRRENDHNAQATATEMPTIIETAPATPEAESPVLEPARVVIEADASAGQKSGTNGDSVNYQEVSDESSTADLAFVDHSVSAGSWQERVAEFKKHDRLDDALEVCRQEYPLWSAYQQASLIHRAKIKQLAQSELDVAAELTALYRLAAEASFLHDRVKGLPNLSLAQLKLLDLSPIAGLEMPYEQIGYAELRLIKKTDIKLLLDNWGKPESHRRPREVHADAWQNLCGDTQSTLF